jgi:hypothetical protein
MAVPFMDDVDEGEGLVEAAVRRDLDRLPAALRGTTSAATAIALARELDRGRLMSTAPVAKELRETMRELAAAAVEFEVKGDAVDDLTKAREERRRAAAAN